MKSTFGWNQNQEKGYNTWVEQRNVVFGEKRSDLKIMYRFLNSGRTKKVIGETVLWCGFVLYYLEGIKTTFLELFDEKIIFGKNVEWECFWR